MKWIPVDCWARGRLSSVALLTGLWANWGYQFGSSSPSRTCSMEHALLLQPLQRKVRALGFKTTFISSFS